MSRKRLPTDKPLEKFGIDTETYTLERGSRQTTPAGSRCAQSLQRVPRDADRAEVEVSNRNRCALAWETSFGEPVPWDLVELKHVHLTAQVLTVLSVINYST